ncbi:hypothetical protein [Pseudomonas monteilii]|uniref:hypothetical protein n=1 Tax=Pseudomonas monteilii TaxID=76759 RepID=UPI001E56521A|nr:hypothetical protein [Pseudomonas monteilii]MCE0925987.1 hypothetical protein [Pseudomonas monteilii]MCE0934674.1 hypothetical protein [Pseudomonas monteilii]MCE0980977.1 hypothetical protein [Pseudomonas monteilii]MCE1012256.1 hypothetical protein [Pseudomonas monteilii]MCE1040962.1 hypothetical protein [Pseudomonas monteilii]
MNSSPTPGQREAVLAQLNASIDSFFAKGGAVQELPGGEYIPHRPHRDLEVIRASIEPKGEAAMTRREKMIVEVRVLAKTMCCAEVMAHTGLSESTLHRAAADGGFHFKPNPNRGKGNLGKKLGDPKQDKALAERIIAARDAGVTMAEAIRRMGISYKLLHRIMDDFGISYPTTAEKKASRIT